MRRERISKPGDEKGYWDDVCETGNDAKTAGETGITECRSRMSHKDSLLRWSKCFSFPSPVQ